jgi:alpha-1,3-rhamnosyl/mannosyltransferase
MRLHLAILTHNALAHTQRCLLAIERHTPQPHEVWIVDNASADATPQWLRAQARPGLHLDFQPVNRGVPGGRNRLLELILPHAGNDDFVVFLDNDLEVGAGWTAPFLEVFAADPQIAIAGRSGHAIVVRDGRRVLLPAATERGFVDVVSGGFACWARVPAARAIGAFDEELGLFWHEDDDWCVRALGLGLGVFAVPDAPMRHDEHGSGVALPDLADGGSLRNQRYLAAKWRGLGLIDEEGWVVQRSPQRYLPPAERRALAQRLGMAAIDRNDLRRVQNDLWRWQRLDPSAFAAELARRPLVALHAALLAEPILHGTLAARIREQRAALRLPQTPRGALSKLCNAEDWDDPRWLTAAREVFGDELATGVFARHRAVWEPAHVLRGLDALGVLHPQARVLLTGPGSPPLANAVRERARVVTDGADRAPVDVACSLGALQECRTPAAVDDALRALAARVRPGGVVAIATDVVLDGSDGLRPDALAAFAARAGLELRGGVDCSLSDATLAGCVDERFGLEALPHLVVRLGGRLIGSAVAFLHKAPARIPAAAPSDAPVQRVGIDVRNLYQEHSLSRGIGHYTRYHLDALVRRMGDWQFVLYGENEPCPAIAPLLARDNVTFATIDAYVPGRLDLFHVPDAMNVSIGFDSPLRIFREAHTTVTFYDLIPLHCYLEHWPAESRAAYRARLAQLATHDCALLAISEATRRDAIDTLGIAPERVHTILAGLNRAAGAPPTAGTIERARARLGLREPYFLHVGALDPHKNFATVLGAFLETRRERPCQLAVIGQRDHHLASFARFCEARRIDGVVFPGFVDREELEALYAGAAALVCLSRHEGFGFPVLEAMARGCPVLAANATSLPEVAGDAALLVEPDRAAAREAMRVLLQDTDLRAELARRGRARARTFEWEAVAERTLAVWRELAPVGP